MILRPFQKQLVAGIRQAWANGARNVCGVSPTGSGKTVTFSHIVASEPGGSVVIAHRHELVSQISLALTRNQVHHRVIGQKHLIRWCQRQGITETGRSYVNQNARCAVASVNTLIRINQNDPWLRQVALWVTDEAHHLQSENMWGKALAFFPNARGLGMTATPERADGRGLGRPDGLIDALVVGPSMRELILLGYLADFKVYGPPSDINTAGIPLSAGGDFSPEPLRAAVHRSHIVGDVVEHYKKLAAGKLGVTFCVDIEAATETATAFRSAGVPAEVVTGKTPAPLRSSIMQRFARGEFKQLCVVDIVSEGTDIPAIDVVSLARPSASYTLVAQQVGRALRPKEGKDKAIVIDHVGNIRRFARVGQCPLTNRPTIELDRAHWTLERRERRSRGANDAIAVRTCPSCLADYPVIMGRTCPYCGHVTEPPGRSSPEQVDGDLRELSPEALARLNGEIQRIDGAPYYPANLPQAALHGIRKRHEERQKAQRELREAMSYWGGARKREGLDESTAQRLFMQTFGIDVATAQTLGRPEAEALRKRVLAGLT